jgi:hypothetical protein
MAVRNNAHGQHRHAYALSHRVFARRMLEAIAIWAALATGGLIVGMAGYAYYEQMSAADAFANAAMILSGMGPLGELKTTGGKIFAGCYALFSGLIIIIATSFVLASVFHRVLHRFHLERGRGD